MRGFLQAGGIFGNMEKALDLESAPGSMLKKTGLEEDGYDDFGSEQEV